MGKFVLYTKHTISRKTNSQKTAKDVDTTSSSNKGKRLQLRTSKGNKIQGAFTKNEYLNCLHGQRTYKGKPVRPDRICVKCKLKIKGMVMNNFYKPGTAITLWGLLAIFCFFRVM